MKTIFTLLLVLTAMTVTVEKANANANNYIISQFCGFNYVEGVKSERSNGRISTVCLSKTNLPDLYRTHLNGTCASTHVEGRRYDYGGSFDEKECIAIDSISEVYFTDSESLCAFGFEPDSLPQYNEGIYLDIACVRSSDV